MTTAASPPAPAAVMEAIEKSNKLVTDSVNTLTGRLDAVEKGQADIKTELAKPQRAPWVTTGPTGQDSQPYSVMRAGAFMAGMIAADQVKNEIDLSNRLKSYLKKYGWTPTHGNSLVVPASSKHFMTIPGDDEAHKLGAEIREKMTAWNRAAVDLEHAVYLAKSAGWTNGQVDVLSKALGSVVDSAGGVLVGFPTLGELIDIQRNLEVFANAGATEVGLPPNGRIQFPKLTGGATAYWVGEGAAITESQETTGYLDLLAKKLAVLVKLNNELIRYASPTAEAMVRLDMARVSARKADLAMLEGTGGNQIKGLLTYDTQSSWTTGTDKLISIAATTTSGTGDTFVGQDANRIVEAFPDEIPEPTAFVMRRAMWAAIKNLRAAAVTTNDAAGQFLFSQFRTLGERPEQMLVGAKVIASSQVSTTRAKGGTSTLSYILAGYFPDWIVARFGVMEFLATQTGDTSLVNDQTWLRGIQLLDAGPRHAASFVLMDTLNNNSGA